MIIMISDEKNVWKLQTQWIQIMCLTHSKFETPLKSNSPITEKKLMVSLNVYVRDYRLILDFYLYVEKFTEGGSWKVRFPHYPNKCSQFPCVTEILVSIQSGLNGVLGFVYFSLGHSILYKVLGENQ